MIARRSRQNFKPSNVDAVHRRFEHIVRKALQKAEEPPKLSQSPQKPPVFTLTRQRRSA